MVKLSPESSFLREAYIDTFVDRTSDYYKSKIEKTLVFSDGICYTGYLWDCLYVHNRVSFTYVKHFLQNRVDPVYIFWDIHSSDLIHIKGYWKYPKDVVLIVSPSDILDVIPTLPEDCYFFDDSLTWTIALTHEEINYKRRICYFMQISEDGQDRGRFA